VAIEDAVAALPEHWDDVVARFGAAKTEELKGLVEAIGGPDHMRAISRIADLIVEGLPPEHPVRRALLEGDLYAAATLDWPAVTALLHQKAAHQEAARPEAAQQKEQQKEQQGAQQRGDPILRGVTERLLSAPALTEDDLRRRGADPADPGLIRLDRPDGGRQWPAFQFAPDGAPWPVVREINHELDAAAYPLGAADWWLSRNGWLGEPPWRLIGRIPDEHLMRAARAIRSEV
jgi:hypothetical protein